LVENSMTSETMFAQSPSISFKLEIEHMVTKNSNKRAVRP